MSDGCYTDRSADESQKRRQDLEKLIKSLRSGSIIVKDFPISLIPNPILEQLPINEDEYRKEFEYRVDFFVKGINRKDERPWIQFFEALVQIAEASDLIAEFIDLSPFNGKCLSKIRWDYNSGTATLEVFDVYGQLGEISKITSRKGFFIFDQPKKIEYKCA